MARESQPLLERPGVRAAGVRQVLRDLGLSYVSNGVIGLIFAGSGPIAVTLAVGAAGGTYPGPARVLGVWHPFLGRGSDPVNVAHLSPAPGLRLVHSRHRAPWPVAAALVLSGGGRGVLHVWHSHPRARRHRNGAPDHGSRPPAIKSAAGLVPSAILWRLSHPGDPRIMVDWGTKSCRGRQASNPDSCSFRGYKKGNGGPQLGTTRGTHASVAVVDW